MSVEFPPAGILVLSWAATYLIHSTCLVAGVWLYLRVHRSAGHALRETLWKTALVGSLLTASAQMLPGARGTNADFKVAVDEIWPARAPATDGLSAAQKVRVVTGDDGPAAERFATDAIASHAGAGAPEATEIFWIPSGIPAGELAATLRENSVSGPGEPRAPARPMATATWRNLLTTKVWQFPTAGLLVIGFAAAFAAIFVGVARCVIQTWSLRRKLERCSVINAGPARRLLDELRRLVPRVPDVLLLAAPDDPEPAAFGVRRWTIVLPARAVRDLSEDELRALLAHELAHLVRGDSVWLCVSRMICSCLAFQPLNHLARREWQRSAEYLCDSWAVSRTGTPLALARCLTEVAGWRLSGRASAALLAATGRKSGLSDRIERLVEAVDLSETWIELRQRRRLLLAGAVLLGIALWCAPRVQVALASPHRAPQEKPDGSQTIGREQVSNPRESVAPNGAKSQADGAEVPSAPSVNGSIAPANAKESAAMNLTALLESLDRDLSALERELHELELLLAGDRASGPVARLAERLRREIGQLKLRRDALRKAWKSGVD